MEIEATKSTRRLFKLKDSELISRLNACIDEDAINELKKEFYFRFAKYIYKVCLIIVDNRGWKQDLAEDIFQDTLKKILSHVQTFIIDATWSETMVRKKILGWLGTIANNELKNFFNKNHVLDEWNEEMYNIEDETESEEPIQISVSLERTKLREAYLLLKPREQYLIDMCAIHNCLNLNKNESEKHFPEVAISEICYKLQIKRNALRIFKQRTIKKLLNHLNQIE